VTPDEVADVQADLERAASTARWAETQLRRDVSEARQRGLTWQQVGDALGITKQAAHERFRASRVALEDRELPL
jgi:uncharacterized NAD(P)/FAD-binding protein YdhS